MIVCPVCEHPQALGDVCDVCGKELVAGWGPGEAPVVPLDGLEQTQFTGAGSAPPPAPMLELEGTRLPAVPDLPPQPMLEIDRPSAAAGPEIPILPLDELDLGRAQDDGQRTALPTGKVACRYCRHEQAEGVFCEACGMRLPKVASETPGAPTTVARGDEEVWGTCSKCGNRAMVGRRCGECGIVMQLSET
jgi:hypothetical protein